MTHYILNRYTFIVAIIISVYIFDKYDSIFLQKVNSHFLVNSDLASRVYPHRVNSIGKLHDIWADGFRSFEVDVIYGYNNSNYFQVGHDHGAIGSTNLEGLLLSIEFNKLDRIWLDIKNLKKSNYLKVIERLEYLEKKYVIKNKVILESSMTLPVFGTFSKQGWHISYYAPTNKILKALESEDTIQLEQIASDIALQSEGQQLSAISFDNRLYPFVKYYLEPLIANKIIYHTWWGPSLESIYFRSDLSKSKLFLDPRVSSILLTYKSRHDI